MAEFPAHTTRATAIELKDKIASLYLAVAALYSASTQWVLNGTDPMLPDPYDVKIVIDGYKDITITALKLEPWASDLQDAGPGDTLTYPPPPISSATGSFDGSATFDGTTTFNGEGKL